MRVITMAHDASFGGWGTCVATQDGPVLVGHLALGPERKRPPSKKWEEKKPPRSTHRDQRLESYLHGPMEHALVDAQLMRRPGDALVRVVIEIPPLGFSGGRASAYSSVNLLVGAITLWGTRRSLACPWRREPGDWRAHWRIPPTRRGRGSPQLKADAIALVEKLWGPQWLQPFNRTKKGGPRGDVAEAILQAVGASQCAHLAPETPDPWPKTPPGNWLRLDSNAQRGSR